MGLMDLTQNVIDFGQCGWGLRLCTIPWLYNNTNQILNTSIHLTIGQTDRHDIRIGEQSNQTQNEYVSTVVSTKSYFGEMSIGTIKVVECKYAPGPLLYTTMLCLILIRKWTAMCLHYVHTYIRTTISTYYKCVTSKRAWAAVQLLLQIVLWHVVVVPLRNLQLGEVFGFVCDSLTITLWGKSDFPNMDRDNNPSREEKPNCRKEVQGLKVLKLWNKITAWFNCMWVHVHTVPGTILNLAI